VSVIDEKNRNTVFIGTALTKEVSVHLSPGIGTTESSPTPSISRSDPRHKTIPEFVVIRDHQDSIEQTEKTLISFFPRTLSPRSICSWEIHTSTLRRKSSLLMQRSKQGEGKIRSSPLACNPALLLLGVQKPKSFSLASHARVRPETKPIAQAGFDGIEPKTLFQVDRRFRLSCEPALKTETRPVGQGSALDQYPGTAMAVALRFQPP
jgi:hypothetical protein